MDGGRGHDPLSPDRSEREAAIEEEGALLREWPTSDDKLTLVKRGFALWKTGEAQFRSRQMTEAAARLEEAVRSFEQLPDMDAALAGALATRAGALLALARYEEAATTAKRAVAVAAVAGADEHVYTGWSVVMVASKALGMDSEAVIAADRLLALTRDDRDVKRRVLITRALLTKAWAARLAGDPEAGLQLVTDAIRRSNEDVDERLVCEALYEQAELLWTSGRASEAIQAFEEVIKKYGDSLEPSAREVVALARGRRRRLQVQRRLRWKSS